MHERVGLEIERVMRQREVTVNELALACGLGRDKVQRILDGEDLHVTLHEISEIAVCLQHRFSIGGKWLLVPNE